MSDLSVAAVFSDGMVLQRDKEVCVWGKGADGETVTASLCGHTVSGAVADGKWRVTFPPTAASDRCELRVLSGGQSITVSNVAIGEIWIAGGQSNMEMAMAFDADAEHETEEDRFLRFFDVPRISYDGQAEDEDFSDYGFWRICDSKNRPYFSAAAYYFGKKLREELQVPIGIVGCNYGGTSASCWLTEQDLRADEELKRYMDEYERGVETMDADTYKQAYLNERRFVNSPQVKAFYMKLMKGEYTPEQVQEILAEYAGSLDMSNPVAGPMHPYRPASLYYTMLGTVMPYGARGVIWYQGEADGAKAESYAKLFTALIHRWREAWGCELPFLFVQIAPFERWLELNGKAFPAVRRQQEIVSKTVPGAYMASIMDCGERQDIHPKRKRPVGERLAGLALGKVYGFDVPCDPPEAACCQSDGTSAEVKFAHCGSGLTVRGDHINGLQVFGESGEISAFKTAVAHDAIRIECAETITEVRFAQQDYVEANLYGNEGLCAKPFALRSEQVTI